MSSRFAASYYTRPRCNAGGIWLIGFGRRHHHPHDDVELIVYNEAQLCSAAPAPGSGMRNQFKHTKSKGKKEKEKKKITRYFFLSFLRLADMCWVIIHAQYLFDTRCAWLFLLSNGWKEKYRSGIRSDSLILLVLLESQRGPRLTGASMTGRQPMT